jgi:indole-3-glycerol phosphate synthase
MTNILAEICDRKKLDVSNRKTSISTSVLLQEIKSVGAPRGFLQSLQQKVHAGKFGLIAEIKKASPSAGLIRKDFDPAILAKAYEAGGAACLSVLTDEPYFQGHDDYLQLARNACQLPVLRKDFMVDTYQIIESRALGADCILLIMATLSDVQAKEMYQLAAELGMDTLFEVHDMQELERTLALSPKMIGINNRNLKTMQVDLATSETLAKHIPPTILTVCESGIRTHNDVQRMKNAGIGCFLVGESLMREADITKATQQLLGS